MNTSARQNNSGDRGRPPRWTGIAAVSLLALGAVAATFWLLQDEPVPDGGDPSAVLAAPPGAHGGESSFDAPAPGDRTDATVAALSEAVPAVVTPLEPGPASLPARLREIEGVTVRASDGERVWAAIVIALQRDVNTKRETELDRARTNTDGVFTLRVPGAVDAFQVLAPPPDQARDDPTPGRLVPVQVEWPEGDVLAREVRLVIDTGWRLDCRVLDSGGLPRSGILVTCGGRSAVTGDDGRGTLLDLPLGAPSFALTLKPASGGDEVRQLIDAPRPDNLRLALDVTLP